MRKGARSLRELSVLLWLYATDIFDPEYIDGPTIENGQDEQAGNSTRTGKDINKKGSAK